MLLCSFSSACNGVIITNSETNAPITINGTLLESFMGTLLENGVELPVAMSLTKNVLGNKAAESVLNSASEALRKGQNFLVPLTKSKLLKVRPP